jgi:phosphoglycolate phosphatase-like HAD superfamily hydrolase
MVSSLVTVRGWGGGKPNARAALLASHMTQWNNPAMIIGDRLREKREEKKLS